MIEYSNSGITGGVLFRRAGSVIPSALVVAIPAGLFSVAIQQLYLAGNTSWGDVMDRVSNDNHKSSQLFGAISATLTFLIGFRVNKAYGRFWDGTTLLHQMWGEWFDAASCLVSFSSLARKAKKMETLNFRHTLVRLMSLMHGSALEEIAQFSDGDEAYETLDIGGLEQPVLRYLKMCKFDMELNFNRVEVLLHMIQTLVVHNHDIGVLKIPPPILSRVFQTLSRGQVNLANCKKITGTLFPFPFAQMISILLMLYTIITPVIMAVVLRGTSSWAFIFTVVPVFGLWGCDYVARELEMPFGNDANDLPLESFQHHMNNSLLMLIRVETDLVASVHENAPLSFEGVKENISRQRPKDVCDGRITIFAKEEELDMGPQDTTRVNLGTLPPDLAKQASTSSTSSVPPSVPAPPPPPSLPGGPVKLDTTDLEKTLSRMMDVLTDKFMDLTTSTKGLADRLNQNTESIGKLEKGQKANGMNANRLDEGLRDDPHMRAPSVAQPVSQKEQKNYAGGLNVPTSTFGACASSCREV